MNRKKKINQILKKKIKKQNSKLHSSNKPKYISKSERAKMEQEAAQVEDVQADENATDTVTDATPSQQKED
ncbi:MULTISPECIES: DUF2986 domain-containing protein [Vibrio]|uniref:DUF2986 domain-containing protein n=1 Tax=Vibrio halioticoli NBRC 102217 TaxID=1219072 RepID=V5FHR7_9VIBR|nr:MULTISPECIES: DUF2986 domain-containing protein [Vibrio]MPW36466.1 DUF2986 domain-containing protein [Vibrio sp. B1Z05]GAD89366.1 hypothetical protein VHA01S_019_00430 [Vibrio halioticoli NBRC 102217]